MNASPDTDHGTKHDDAQSAAIIAGRKASDARLRRVLVGTLTNRRALNPPDIDYVAALCAHDDAPITAH